MCVTYLKDTFLRTLGCENEKLNNALEFLRLIKIYFKVHNVHFQVVYTWFIMKRLEGVKEAGFPIQ